MRLEDLIEKTGGCGKYQILLCIIVHSMKTVVCFSMLFMVFGAAKPDWWCTDDFNDLNVTFTTNMTQYKSCTAKNGTTPCKNFFFEESMKTTVTQVFLLTNLFAIGKAVYSLKAFLHNPCRMIV